MVRRNEQLLWRCWDKSQVKDRVGVRDPNIWNRRMSSELTPEAQGCASDPDHIAQRKAAPSMSATQPRGRRRQASAEELPKPGVRWVISRKAQVVAAVEAGRITLEEVCGRYSISEEEFKAWQVSLSRHGVYGLRITRSQLYRAEEPRDSKRKR